ncbi:MAG: hypothetical protein HC830_15590 [Bacteroidetes bacterium]|nr:hypothetical protein [Bacteroidota bacterium]
MLDLSKIEAGQQVIVPEIIEMDELLGELNDFFQGYSKSKGKEAVKLVFNKFDNPANVEIITDKGKLKQILINLVNNALKFTNSGKIEVSCGNR